MAERKKFREVFQESSDETLTLLIAVKVKGQSFPVGTSFTAKEGLAGVDFHKFRYLDVAGNMEANGTFEILGFYPQS